MLGARKQTAIVFFLDETFEELEYDATATVLEAVEFLAGVIKLQAYQTFTLYECRKVPSQLTHALPASTAGKPLWPLKLCYGIEGAAGTEHNSNRMASVAKHSIGPALN